MGETVNVGATVHTIGGFSAHADQEELIEWLQHFKKQPKVILVHGEPGAQEALQQEVEQRLGYRPDIAKPELKLDLIQMRYDAPEANHY